MGTHTKEKHHITVTLKELYWLNIHSNTLLLDLQSRLHILMMYCQSNLLKKLISQWETINWTILTYQIQILLQLPFLMVYSHFRAVNTNLLLSENIFYFERSKVIVKSCVSGVSKPNYWISQPDTCPFSLFRNTDTGDLRVWLWHGGGVYFCSSTFYICLGQVLIQLF